MTTKIVSRGTDKEKAKCIINAPGLAFQKNGELVPRIMYQILSELPVFFSPNGVTRFVSLSPILQAIHT